MAYKFGRKGKNPGVIDSWLDTLGYYRKNIAYDETCLFRAVSEQLYFSQMFHERIRKECIDFARKNFYLFKHLVKDEEDWFEHLHKLEIHMIVCDNIEIQIISKRFQRDVLVFDGMQLKVQDVTNNKYSESLLLCKTSEDHYDVVYKRDYILTAGFCQSIAYGIVYENVFQIENVSSIVNSMLYDKTAFTLSVSHAEYLNEETKEDRVTKSCAVEAEELKEMTKLVSETDEDIGETKGSHFGGVLIAPFPFKVAKALDPTIYRNIEYDTWIEVRRELRLGEWYNGDGNLILGTRCILHQNNEELCCYIQEILKNENKCVVYITSLAERRTVLYSDLRPEDDAKPWPLPYRFSRNLVMLPPPLQLPNKEHRNAKKKKEKKRNKTSSESSAHSGAGNSSSPEMPADVSVNAYEGCPLQMKDEKDSDTPNQSINQTEQSPLPQESEAQWLNEWGQMTYTPEPSVWPQTPTSPQSPYPYGYRPVINAMPVYSYQEPPPNVHYYYSYPTLENYGQTYSWPTSSELVSPEVSYTDEGDEVQVSQDSYITSPKYYYYPSSPYPTPPTSCDKVVTNPVTPSSPQDYYPVVYSAPPPPGTPIYYIPPPPPAPKIPEVVIPTPPISVYSPSADVQYISPPALVFSTPPTPQGTWYPPNVSTQGFIFPTPVPAPQSVTN